MDIIRRVLIRSLFMLEEIFGQTIAETIDSPELVEWTYVAWSPRDLSLSRGSWPSDGLKPTFGLIATAQDTSD